MIEQSVGCGMALGVSCLEHTDDSIENSLSRYCCVEMQCSCLNNSMNCKVVAVTQLLD